MSELALAGFLILCLFVLLGSGLWIGMALLGVGYIAMALFTTRPVGDAMVTTIWGSSSGFTLTALPMFIWMGEILFRSKLSEELFSGLAPWMARLPGRLLHTNVIGCAIFAAISGSSAATCATIGRMTIPELRQRQYPEALIVGTLAGSGTLGLLIPPSLILIVYGVAANVSIAQLFVAGILPGIMLALLFSGYVFVWDLLHPGRIPREAGERRFAEMVRSSRNLLPAVCLIVLVLGSIYGGIATATEAAALGVVGALALSAIQGTLTRATFFASLLGATRLSCMITLILAGASFLTLAMGYTGLPRDLAGWIEDLELTPLALIAALALFYMLLGCFLDGISMVVLTMAVVLPTIEASGFDLIWFGIFIVIVVEMAQITPPVGFNLFVLQGMTGRDIGYIARSAVPFFLLMVLAVVLITLFPEIVLYLPQQMMNRPA